jgi:hypothetical protein
MPPLLERAILNTTCNLDQYGIFIKQEVLPEVVVCD